MMQGGGSAEDRSGDQGRCRPDQVTERNAVDEAEHGRIIFRRR